LNETEREKAMAGPQAQTGATSGQEHWTNKGDDVRLFLWEKAARNTDQPKGTVLFVHGSSMASTPTFDLQIPDRPYSSVMDYFADGRPRPATISATSRAEPTISKPPAAISWTRATPAR
jgi:hypothetical protein